MDQNNTIQNTDIDFQGLLSIFKKQKKLIWFITTIFMLLSLIYLFITKPVYEAKTIIELARIDKTPVQNANDIKQKIEFIYHVNLKGKKIELPIVKSVSLPKKSENLIVITTHGYTNSSAKKKLEEVISYLSSIQNEELDIYLQTQQKRLSLIKEDMKRNQELSKQIEHDVTNYKEKLLGISREDAALAGIYSIEIGKKQTELNTITNKIYSLKNETNNIELSISPLRIHKTAIVGEIETLDKAVKPKKVLILIVTFFTGLMFSVFLAFFLDFLKEK